MNYDPNNPFPDDPYGANQRLYDRMATQPMQSPVALGSDLLATALMKYGQGGDHAPLGGVAGQLLAHFLPANMRARRARMPGSPVSPMDLAPRQAMPDITPLPRYGG